MKLEQPLGLRSLPPSIYTDRPSYLVPSPSAASSSIADLEPSVYTADIPPSSGSDLIKDTDIESTYMAGSS